MECSYHSSGATPGRRGQVGAGGIGVTRGWSPMARGSEARGRSMSAGRSDSDRSGDPVAFRVFRALASRETVLVFDLGGSWWRVGVLTGAADLRLLERVAAVNRVDTGKSAAAIQRELVDFVVDRTRRWADRYSVRVAGISMGAAVDGHTGSIIASAPLWGPEATDFDLVARLRAVLPEILWTILNDVSALACALLRGASAGPGGKVAAVTISSGIAYRTIDVSSGRIPLEPTYGLQGEIGHLPGWMTVAGRPVSADCECGAPNHVAAFSSGRGILRLLGRLPEAGWLRGEDGDSRRVLEDFGAAVARREPRAVELLDAFTRPVALVLLYQATLDPEVDQTVLTGGVVDRLGDHYLASLQRNLSCDGLYLISDRDPDYFASRIVCGPADGLQPLRGVGLYVRGLENYGR